jgi:AcrR family transcriptional regulator
MGKKADTNKHGQSMGRKGRETRQRIMAAARKMLKSSSPVQLTVVSIAKEAETSSATFYLYFKDVRGLLLVLSEEAEADMRVVHEVLDEPWDPKFLDLDHASRVVQAYVSVWDKHREVLRIRNLEADRGDPEFENIRLRTSVRMVSRFAEHIFAAYPEDTTLSYTDAMAEGSVLVAAMERLAATDLEQVHRGVGTDAMWRGMTRIIAQTLNAALPIPGNRGGSKTARGATAKTGSRTKPAAKKARTPGGVPA